MTRFLRRGGDPEVVGSARRGATVRRPAAVAAALVAALATNGSDCGPNHSLDVLWEVTEPIDLTLTAGSPEAGFIVRVSGNENAFWNLSGQEQGGKVEVFCTVTNTSSVAEPVTVWCDLVPEEDGLPANHEVTRITTLDSGGTGSLFIYETWFEGVCDTPGGCGAQIPIEVSLEAPIAGQQVDVELYANAELWTEPSARPGGNPHLTVELIPQ